MVILNINFRENSRQYYEICKYVWDYKGFDRWLHLVDVELKEKLEKYGVKVHFACANDEETRVYDMSEIDDPSLVEAFMADEEVIKLRTEAGVNLSSAEMLSTVDKFKIW